MELYVFCLLVHNTLSFLCQQALKKALFKTSAFFKGIILALCEVSKTFSSLFVSWLVA